MADCQADVRKTFGLWDSVATIIAITVGVGIFRTPAEVAKYLSSQYLIIFAWFAGGIISLLGALCYTELAAAFPQTGGNYVYLRESYGNLMSFLFGWTELLVIRTGSIAAVAFVCAEYLRSLFAVDAVSVKLIAVSVVFGLSIINITGVQYVKRTQNIFMAAKILALLGIMTAAVTANYGNLSNFHSNTASIEGNIFVLFGLALIPIMWTYGGWHENTFIAGETRNAARTIPVALILGVTAITLLYMALNCLYIYVGPLNKMPGSELFVSDMFKVVKWGNPKKIFEALVVIFSIGSINAMIATGSRVTYAMASDNRLFKYIGKNSGKYGTPHRAIIINAAWSIILIASGTFNQLLFFTGALVWLFFMLVIGGLFVLRFKSPHINRPYRVIGYPVVPAIFIVICSALFINTLMFYRMPSLIGLCLLLSGIPVYALSRAKTTALIVNNDIT